MMTPLDAGKRSGRARKRSLVTLSRCAVILAVAGFAASCSSNQTPREDTAGPRPGPQREYDPTREDSVFGDGGVSIGTLNSARAGGILGGPEEGRLPVNKYMWQAALDTLSFLPLSSTDPFTGVIVTDWGATPEAPGERFKVTAFIVSPVLSAASLKVAVYRETRNADGIWLPAQVSPETARKLEDAILTRARQIRIADLGEGSSG
jgi:hypothetical protein